MAEGSGDVEAGWRDAFEAGHAAWPAVTFAAFRERARALGLHAVPERFAAADFVLACACLAGDEAAIAHFDRGFVVPATAAVERVRRQPAFVADVLQELRKRLLAGPAPRLAAYQGRGALAAWVQIAASRLAIEVSLSAGEKARPAARADLAETLAAAPGEPELALLKQRYQGVFQTALTDALAELGAQDRTVLRMNVVDGLSIDEIARPYKVHRATVARWLQNARRDVFEGVRARLAAVADLPTHEFESLARLIQSRLHVSLDRLLGRGANPPDDV